MKSSIIAILFLIEVLFNPHYIHANEKKISTLKQAEEIEFTSFYELIDLPKFKQLGLIVEAEYRSIPAYLGSADVSTSSACVLSLASRNLPIEGFLKLQELLLAEWQARKLSTEMFNTFVFRCGMRQTGRLQNLHRNDRASDLIDRIMRENKNRSNELNWLTPEFVGKFKSGYLRRIFRAENRISRGKLSTAFLVLDDTNEVAKYDVSELAVEKIKENYYLWYLIGAIFIVFTIFSIIRRNWMSSFIGLFGAIMAYGLGWGLMVGIWIFPI